MMTKRDLSPYVPRLLLEWDAETPEARFREIPGTMAFMDLSGFTAMSERLARKGKVGAEEVSDAIDTTFSELLQIAHEAGGGLLKFGGDALLLFYQGAEHVSRACSSAVHMRRRLREMGHLKTSAGNIQLRMRVGIHSGDFFFCLAGESHHELIVTGPGATSVSAMEGAASTGEIVVSARTAEVLDMPDLIGEPRGAGFLLKGTPPMRDYWVDPPDREFDLEVYVPAIIREHILAGMHESEHRRVTAAFVRFEGVDAVLASRKPSEASRYLNDLVSVIQSIASEEGVVFLGTDVYPDGGKVILAAGAPRASGNDEERMLRSVRRTADRFPEQLRIGVTQGRVFAGEIGTKFRRTYTVMGDAINLAARLMQRANAGQILTTSEVLTKSRTEFEIERLEAFLPKGKKKPVIPSEVGPLKGTTKLDEGISFPLAGRDKELQRLITAFEGACAGRGALIQVIGEAGVGKSRLIDEVKSRNPDANWLHTACGQYATATPYFVFRQVLRTLCGTDLDSSADEVGVALANHVREIAPELLEWLPLIAKPAEANVADTRETAELDQTFRKARLHEVVRSYLEHALVPGTTMVIEDVHWMDDASNDLLNYLAQTITEEPWLICLSRRYPDRGFVPEPGISCEPLDLHPLEDAEATRLAREILGEVMLPGHRISELVDRSGGNPLFLQEIIRAVMVSDTDDALPESVESVIASRIDRLEPNDRALLRHASVLGMVVNEDLLLRSLDDSPDEQTWSRLNSFIQRDSTGHFRFQQNLFREVAYEGLAYKRRRDLHARAGAALEGLGGEPEDYAELASLHFSRANDHSKAWRYSLMAAGGAKDKYANVEAAAFYKRAIEAARHLDALDPNDLASVWEDLGMVSELAALYSDASRAFRTARRLSGDVVVNCRLLYLQGQMDYRAGKHRQALRWYTRALNLLDQAGEGKEASRLRVRLLISIAQIRYVRGQYDDCLKLGERAAAEAETAGDRPGLAHAYSLLHMTSYRLRRPERSKYRDLPLGIYEEIGDLRQEGSFLNNLGAEAKYEGRWTDAISFYQRAKEVFQRSGNVSGSSMIANNIGELLAEQGRVEEAVPYLNEALEGWRPARFEAGIAETTSLLGRVMARQGDFSEAERLLGEAQERGGRIKAQGLLLRIEGFSAELDLLRGNAETALRRIDEALISAKHGSGMADLQALLHRLRGVALLQLGESDDARAALEESVRIARAAGADYELGMSLRTLADSALLMGTNRNQCEHEAREILDRLGVVSTHSLL